MKAQAVDRGHGGLFGRLAYETMGDQTERIGMIGIHVLDDGWRGFGERVRSSASVVLRGNPSHHTKTANEVNARHLQPPIRKIRIVLPVFRVLIPRKIQFAHLRCRRFQNGAMSVNRAAPSGSPETPGWVMSRLARGSCCRFWVCMAMLLIKNTGLRRNGTTLLFGPDSLAAGSTSMCGHLAIAQTGTRVHLADWDRRTPGRVPGEIYPSLPYHGHGRIHAVWEWPVYRPEPANSGKHNYGQPCLPTKPLTTFRRKIQFCGGRGRPGWVTRTMDRRKAPAEGVRRGREIIDQGRLSTWPSLFRC